jgi:Ca2+-dependent lipid-binding protein
VLAARGLRAADRNGLSDPYVVVRVGSEKSVTATREGTLNPAFSETFVFSARAVAEACRESSRVFVEVWDWDAITADDFLGQVRRASACWRCLNGRRV